MTLMIFDIAILSYEDIFVISNDIFLSFQSFKIRHFVHIPVSITCVNLAFQLLFCRPPNRDLREAIQASRKRRGVAEQVTGNGDGNDSTQIGSNGQNTTGRNSKDPRGSNTIPPAPTTHVAKTVLIPSGDR